MVPWDGDMGSPMIAVAVQLTVDPKAYRRKVNLVPTDYSHSLGAAEDQALRVNSLIEFVPADRVRRFSWFQRLGPVASLASDSVC